MKWVHFKKIRLGTSIFFFLAVLLIFSDHKSFFPKSFIDSVLFLQFLPSLLKFISLFAITSLGFLIVILLTILSGRIYCSTICPLGTLQDIITWVSRRLQRNSKKKKHFFRFSAPQNLWRYGILGLVVFMLLGGITFGVVLLDPYSNFGRFTTNFVKPGVVYLNNLVVAGLEKFNQFWIYPEQLRHITWISLIFPAGMLTLVLSLSFLYGRLYCNTICPVGTLLGFLSRYSWFRLAIDEESCNQCKSCAYECKASCIDSKKQEIDFSRCVMCFNCFIACKKEAIYFHNTWRKREIKNGLTVEKPNAGGINRRGFFAGILAILAWSSGFKARPTLDALKKNKPVNVTKQSLIPIQRKSFSSPPGSKSIAHFNTSCTGCSLCISACPNNALQPSFLEYGWSGIMQPYMDYSSGFCNYDCKICGDICPTGAISFLSTIDKKKAIQVGKAKFIKENCVVFTEHTDCGACSEHCPTKAVDMIPFEDTGLFIPEVNTEICVGCGACEYPCPVRPYKAIYVEGNPEHLVAEKPKTEKLIEENDVEEDFPF